MSVSVFKSGWCTGALFLLALLLCVRDLEGKPQDGMRTANDDASKLIREGTMISVESASCRFDGERLIVDIPGHDRLLRALPNLMAQRIVDALQLDPNDSAWEIDAEVTEYYDQNFLLIRRARRTANPDRL